METRPSYINLFGAIGGLLLAAGGFAVALHKRRKRPKPGILSRDDLVDEAGLESFPASDPPSWTLGEDDRS